MIFPIRPVPRSILYLPSTCKNLFQILRVPHYHGQFLAKFGLPKYYKVKHDPFINYKLELKLSHV